jgi:RNA polymerase sigma factor (sigma-70 family)
MSDPTGATLKRLGQAVWRAASGDRSDRELLEHFLARRDDAAFGVLVQRHGPMVLGVCRRVVGNHHDAEDAFQATFLVLARKASVIARRDLLAGWLHGVAHRTALEMRRRTLRRQSHERQVEELPQQAAAKPTETDELFAVLDQELSRLPAKYHEALVLCDLEGRSRQEAAAQLGIPEGTLSSRLAAGRQQLARRLARHGLYLSAPLLAGVLAEKATAELPSVLATATVRAVAASVSGPTAAAGGLSPDVVVVSRKVMSTMWWKSWKSLVMIVLALVALGGAVGWAAHLATGGEPVNPGTKSQAETPFVAHAAAVGHQEQQPQPKPIRRYDGKTISTWETVLQTELKPERLIEAIKAMQAFGLNGDGKEASEALIRFVAQYRSPVPIRWHLDDQVYMEVVQALSVMKEPAQPTVRNALRSSDRIVRMVAVDAFVLAAGPAETMPAEIRQALTDKDPSVRYRAAQALRYYRKDPGTIVALRKMLRDKSPVVRQNAVAVLADLVQSSQNPQAGRSGGTPDGATGPWDEYSRDAANVALAALYDADPVIRDAAWRFTRQLQPNGAMAAPHLARMLRNTDREKRLWAADRLARSGQKAKGAVPALIEAFRQEKDLGVRTAIVRALASMNQDARAALPLLRAIQRPVGGTGTTGEVAFLDAVKSAIRYIEGK